MLERVRREAAPKPGTPLAAAGEAAERAHRAGRPPRTRGSGGWSLGAAQRPAQSSGALARRRRCRTSVSRLQPCPSGPGGSGPGKVGEGKTRDPAPPGTGCPPRLSQCVLPPRRVGDAAPTPRERLLGTGQLRSPLGPGA